VTSETTTRQRVVVIAGPSGSGKSRLTARLHAEHGWPVFRLDDFYKDGDDPTLPMAPGLGIPDWDDVRSWNLDAALAALTTLVDTGTTQCPVYDLATSRATGHHVVTCGPHDLVLAEGIFAAETISALRRAGLLHSAWTLSHRPVVNFARRLSRDLAERRKPPHVLLRRGVALLRGERALVERQRALGARSARVADVEARLRAVG
jgi:uridine kinase